MNETGKFQTRINDEKQIRKMERCMKKNKLASRSALVRAALEYYVKQNG
jgi:metal-responsive CopG/Arc/MetJ family transcriptional regulator